MSLLPLDIHIPTRCVARDIHCLSNHAFDPCRNSRLVLNVINAYAHVRQAAPAPRALCVQSVPRCVINIADSTSPCEHRVLRTSRTCHSGRRHLGSKRHTATPARFGQPRSWQPSSERSLSSRIQRKVSEIILSLIHARVNEFSMTNFESRSNVQLRLLGQTRCVHDLVNVNRSTREVRCNNCMNPEDAHHDTVYHHRISVGLNIDPAVCNVCAHSLSFSRPAYYCSSCFKIALDFLCSRSNSELADIDCSAEPHIILLERHCISHSGQRTE